MSEELKIGDLVEVLPDNFSPEPVGTGEMGIITERDTEETRSCKACDFTVRFGLDIHLDYWFCQCVLRKIKPDHQPCEEAFSDELKLMLKGKVSA